MIFIINRDLLRGVVVRKMMVWLSAVFISGAIFAENSPFSPGPAPTQVYHEASSTTPAASQTVTQTTATTPTTTSSSPDMSNGAAMINTAGVDTNIESQVSMLSQASIAFEQETDQHIQNLMDSNQAMGAALQTTNQEVVQLQEAVAKLAAGNNTTSPSAKHLHGLNHEDLNIFIAFGGAAAFLLLLGVLMGRFMRRRAPVMMMPSASDDTKSEYDFMSTAEAIPAKLDLARSYLMMGDFDQARIILKSVIEKGSDEHLREAENMLNKIKNSAGN